MGFDFVRPLLLIALPVALGFTIATYFRMGARSLKTRVALVVRSVAIALLCLAMAGLTVVTRSNDATLLILADRSQSLAGQRNEMEGQIRDIAKALPDHYRVGVLAFGRNAAVEQHFAGASAFSRFETMPDARYSDLGSALQFGAALFEAGGARQILLMSDGKENLGDAQKTARALQAQGVRVDVMAFDSTAASASSDAQVSALSIPPRVYEGEAFDIKVTLHANAAKTAKLFLYGDRQLMAEKDVELQAGENVFVFEDVAQRSGVVQYQAVLQESGGATQNNQLTSIAKVVGKARVLLVEGSDGDARELEKMLTAAGMAVDLVPPASLSADLAQWQPYQACVLANVSAEDLRPEQIEAMGTFVRAMGRGLLTTGGDNSYALGGYIGSPLAELLPVDMDVKNKLDMPSLGLVLVIDKSGSMSDGRYGITRQDLANEAAVRSLEVLSAKDSIGVVAFDGAAKWVVGMQHPTDVESIKNLIGSIRPGGGTMMYGALNEAMLALEATDSKLKHVICLTDGQPGDTGFDQLAMEMRERGITLSTVGVGEGANQALLQQIALLGDGRYYDANEFSNLPQIFAKETFLATQSYLQNVTFTPKLVESSPITDGFAGFPQLDGYIATVMKPTASELLTSDKDTPILAQWQLGLGRVASWTSDARGMWTKHYLAWEEGGRFFSSIVDFLLPGEGGEGAIDATVTGETGTISVHAGRWEGIESQATIINPDGTTQTIALDPTAPGQSEGKFDATQEGAYTIRVEQSKDGEAINVIEGGVPAAYSPEFDIRQKDGAPLLEAIRTATGGFAVASASELFAHPMDRVESRVEIWPWLLLIGFLLFFADIALRRLRWDRRLIEAVAAGRAKREARHLARQKAEAPAPKRPPTDPPSPTPPPSPQAPHEPAKPSRGNAPNDADLGSELLRRRQNKKKM